MASFARHIFEKKNIFVDDIPESVFKEFQVNDAAAVRQTLKTGTFIPRIRDISHYHNFLCLIVLTM